MIVSTMVVVDAVVSVIVSTVVVVTGNAVVVIVKNVSVNDAAERYLDMALRFGATEIVAREAANAPFALQTRLQTAFA